MDTLAPLDIAAAMRFCAEVPFEERFSVSFIGKHGGFQPIPVFSARELVRVGRGADTVLSVDALTGWIEHSLCDAGLARIVGAACADKPLFEQAKVAVRLVSERLEQAHVVLEASSAPQQA